MDKLANCYVKRNSTTKDLELGDGPELQAPEGLALRDLITEDEELF